MRVRPKFNAYEIVSRAVEAGVSAGLRRADKHASDPLTDAQRERVAEHIEREVVSAICEVVHFD